MIVQADVQKHSFIAAYDLKTGKQVWRTERDEISDLGHADHLRATAGPDRDQRPEDPRLRSRRPASCCGRSARTPRSPSARRSSATGWSTSPAAIRRSRPIYAVKPTAAATSRCRKTRRRATRSRGATPSGTYIPTPLYYDGILYTCSNNGVLTAYDAKTGERIYRARVGGGGSFAASPVAADGKLYFANEDGDVIVARAGRKYEELAKNEMKEVIMGTPAISDGLIVVRTLGHVYGIANP